MAERRVRLRVSFPDREKGTVCPPAGSFTGDSIPRQGSRTQGIAGHLDHSTPRLGKHTRFNNRTAPPVQPIAPYSAARTCRRA